MLSSPFSRPFLWSPSSPSSYAYYQTKKINGTPICQAPAQSRRGLVGWFTAHSWHALYSKSVWPQSPSTSFQVGNLPTIKFVTAPDTHKKCTTKKEKMRGRGCRMFTRMKWRQYWRLHSLSQWMTLPASGAHQAMMPPPVESSVELLICPCFATSPAWAYSVQTAASSVKASVVLPRGDSNCGSCQDNQTHCIEERFDFCIFLWFGWLREDRCTRDRPLPRLQPLASLLSDWFLLAG